MEKVRPLGETAPLKIFINDANTFVAQAIIEEIRNDHQAFDSDTFNSHKIVATITDRENAKPPSGITKIIAKNKKKAVYQSILSSDIVIFDINFGSTEDVDSIVKFLKEQHNGIPKPITMIILSSVMSWSGTDPKEPKNKEIVDNSEDEDMTAEERERLMTTDFIDEDYLTRMPSTRFANLKYIENLVLQLPKFQPSITSYIVCTGILYGNGERTLYEHFRKAWTGTGLPLLGEGNNRLPTIHVQDAAKLIKKIIYDKPKQPYILAVDEGKCTQKQIVEALSQGKDKRISQVDILEVYSEEWSDYLNIDIAMRPSKLFDSSFQWTCRDGLCKHISLIFDQFSAFRGLNPIRVSIFGPPKAGKTKLAKALKKLLQIPRLNLREVFDLAKKSQSQIVKKIQQKENEIKDKIVEEQLAAKKKPADIDKEKIQVKFPDRTVGEVVRFVLKSQLYKTKGLIYDNFPKSEKQAKRLFYSIKGENDQDDDEGFFNQLEHAKVHLKKLPNVIIHLRCSREASAQRFKIQQQESGENNSNITEAEFERRMNEYENNYHGLVDFYRDIKESTVKIVEIDTMGKKLDDIYRIAKDQVFQYYKFLDYLYVSEDNEKALIEKLQKQEELRAREEQIQKKVQQEQALKLQQQLALQKGSASGPGQENRRVNTRLQKIDEKKHFLLDTKSLPIRQYLLDKIIPTLTKGIMEMTDKLDFEKVTEEEIFKGTNFFEGDFLDHLIRVFEMKGDEFREEYLEAQRKKELEKELERKKSDKGKGEDSEDYEEESPDEVDASGA